MKCLENLSNLTATTRISGTGFTLVELMIAMVVGSTITIGLMTFVMISNKTISLDDAISNNQEAGLFTLDYIKTYAQLAGYSDDDNMPKLPLYIDSGVAGSLVRVDCAGADSDACAASDPDPTDPTIRGDRLSLAYYASDNRMILDCISEPSGGPPGGGGGGGVWVPPTSGPERYVVNVFWVNNDRELVCRSYDGGQSGAGGTNDWIGDAEVLLEGVETMEVLVGVANTDSEVSAARYIPIDEVVANGLNNEIRSIRVSILTTSQRADDNINEIQNTREVRQYSVLDNDSIPAFDDGFIRRVYTTTVSFSNL